MIGMVAFVVVADDVGVSNHLISIELVFVDLVDVFSETHVVVMRLSRS